MGRDRGRGEGREGDGGGGGEGGSGFNASSTPYPFRACVMSPKCNKGYSPGPALSSRRLGPRAGPSQTQVKHTIVQEKL